MTSPAQMNRLLRRRRWARWGLLLTTLALAAALLGSAWAGYRSAEDAVLALERAQAGTLAAAFRGGAFGAWERARVRGSDRAEVDPLPRGVDSAGEGVVPDSTSGRVIGRGVLSGEEIAATIDSIVTDRSEAGLRWAGFLSSAGTVVAGGGDAMDEPFRVSSSQGGPTLTHVGPRVRAYFVPPLDTRRSRLTLVVEFEPVIARAMVSSARRSLFL
ncbi:MAG: hypothetical protein HKN73_14240, partial [Gemmatimonadetes bacterium]|nr:hypothetical protein [Gemmatimonadota bacterium]